jgi:ribosomal protein S18 acetylase RimI-like enzyme
MGVDIRQATEADIETLYTIYDVLGKQDAGYFEECFEKECLILIASCGSPLLVPATQAAGMTELVNVAFGVLNFNPKYNLYQKLDIPEIQDLNVIPDARQQGVATQMVTAFENIARDQGYEQMGISVGLTKDYGAAQRLYVKLGYMPDGYGVTYDREGVTAGASYPVDDELALMMVKEL